MESLACEPVCSKCSIIPGIVTFLPSEIAVTSYFLPSINFETFICSNEFSAIYLCKAGKSKTTADFCFLPLLVPPIKAGKPFLLTKAKMLSSLSH